MIVRGPAWLEQGEARGEAHTACAPPVQTGARNSVQSAQSGHAESTSKCAHVIIAGATCAPNQAGSSRDCRQAALSINPVRPTDVGEYSLIVRSPKGVAEGSVLVNVTGAVGHVSSSGVSPIIVHPTSICIVMYLVALVLS
ncbi:unnamed protein product [Bemisia tabaci]|uniref:Uncharacterized protein n=1 Tax=Bemisia tabaci TaxID=7038 RepID=A0A9P0A0C8_BEMTA|nr:unnamed protein product [Bemisia tabaci]